MADTNICTIAGRLTREPELRTTTSGKSVATMTLATEDGWGENKKTYFIPIVAWGKTAEACANYLVKGQKATVTGRITTRSWDGKDGKRHSITEIVATNVDFGARPKGVASPAQDAGLPAPGAKVENVADEDVPF